MSLAKIIEKIIKKIRNPANKILSISVVLYVLIQYIRQPINPHQYIVAVAGWIVFCHALDIEYN